MGLVSKKDKLLKKIHQRPKDFAWEELETLLKGFGYKQVKKGKSGGSRRRFIHSSLPTIMLHKPHPGNVLKMYQVDQIIEILKKEEIL